jgi:hypothetical protein
MFQTVSQTMDTNSTLTQLSTQDDFTTHCYCESFKSYNPKGYHLDVVGRPSTPHDPESDASGSLSSWQGHPSR